METQQALTRDQESWKLFIRRISLHQNLVLADPDLGNAQIWRIHFQF